MDEEILKRLGEISRRLGEMEARAGVQKKPEREALKTGVPEERPAPSSYTGSPFDPLVSMPDPGAPPKPPISQPAPKDSIGYSPISVSTGELPGAVPARGVRAEKKNVESYIGRWFLGIVGIVAVILGTSFFLKYAFENNLIGEVGRVALGVAGGLLFVIAGEVMRSRYKNYSYILSGGGLGLFYLSIYGAFHYYDLIGQTTAFGFMLAVTAFGVVLSLWADALPLAALAAFGGFLTPFLLSSGVPNDAGLFGYLGILNIGILAVAFFKKWRELTLLGFTATVLNFASWFGAFYEPDKLFFTVGALSVFYVIFLLTGFASNVATRTMSTRGDLFVLTVNAAWYFGWCYYLLHPQYDLMLGFLAAGLGAVYLFFAYAATVIHPEDRNYVLSLGGLSVLFLTIAIPLALKQNAITIAWAVEAGVLFLIGFAMSDFRMRFFAMVVLVLSMFRFFGYDGGLETDSAGILIFNKRFFTYVVLIAVSFIMGYVAHLKRDVLVKEERGVQPFLWSAANVLLLIAVTMEILGFYGARIADLEKEYREKQISNTPVLQEGANPFTPPSYLPKPVSGGEYEEYYAKIRSLTNQRNAVISVFWALYAIVLMAVGMIVGNKHVRWSALALFGITTFKVFILDLASLKTPYRIISFTVLGLILLFASYLYFRYQKSIEGQKENTAQ